MARPSASYPLGLAARLSLASLALLLTGAGAWPWDYSDPFRFCYSDINITGARAMSQKGFTMDDVTLRFCPTRIPTMWPNTQDPVSSVRLFRSWAEGWPEERRGNAWRDMLDFVAEHRVKVMVATPITCDVAEDNQNWAWTREFLQRLRPDQVMGFAVGNELDLLYTHETNDKQCITSLWEGGRAWRLFTERVADIDRMGFDRVPVTSVFTAGVLYGGNRYAPFANVHGKALVNDFLKNATRKYSYRFAFTFNIYPYFDPSLEIKPPHHTCESSLRVATCFTKGCLVSKALVLARQKMEQLTRRRDDRLWIGEIGWSSPQAAALGTAMTGCPDFSSLRGFRMFYENFLKWDLSVDGVKDPDHVFYFTLRDALNFGLQEYFGVIPTCQSLECKIKSEKYKAPPVLRGQQLPLMRIGFLSCGLLLLVAALLPPLCRRLAHRRGSATRAKAVDNEGDIDDSESSESDESSSD